MAQLVLKASKRVIVGRKVKDLRRQNKTPIHLFGHGVESLALQSETSLVERSLRQAGETRLISLTVDNEQKARPVLVREVQRDPLSGKLLHVDLYQVKMGEKVTVEVPIILAGDARTLLVKGSSLIQQLDSLTIECLPDRIPENLRLDISSLTEPGQAKRVKDIQLAQDIVVLNDVEQIVAVVVARPEEKATEKAAEEATAEAAAPASPEAGATSENKEES